MTQLLAAIEHLDPKIIANLGPPGYAGCAGLLANLGDKIFRYGVNKRGQPIQTLDPAIAAANVAALPREYGFATLDWEFGWQFDKLELALSAGDATAIAAAIKPAVQVIEACRIARPTMKFAFYGPPPILDLARLFKHADFVVVGCYMQDSPEWLQHAWPNDPEWAAYHAVIEDVAYRTKAAKAIGKPVCCFTWHRLDDNGHPVPLTLICDSYACEVAGACLDGGADMIACWGDDVSYLNKPSTHDVIQAEIDASGLDASEYFFELDQRIIARTAAVIAARQDNQ